MHAAARQLLERPAIDRLDRNAQLMRARDERVHARAGAALVNQPRTRRALSASPTALMP